MSEIVDCHARLEALARAGVDLRAACSEWQAAGVSRVLSTSADLESSQASVELAWSVPRVRIGVGVAPSRIADRPPSDEELAELREIASDPLVVAIGEIGLDAEDSDVAAIQEEAVLQLLRLAADRGLPVIISCSVEVSRLIDLWDRISTRRPGAVIALGEVEPADPAGVEALVDRRFYLSLGPDAVGLAAGDGVPERVVRAIPEDRLLVHSGAGLNGDRNDPVLPAVAGDVAQRIAELRSSPVDELRAALARNSREVFR
jgi:TatD DNase family protein